MRLKKIGNYYHAQFQDSRGHTQTLTTRQTDKRLAQQTVKESGIADLEQAAKSGRLTTEAIGKIITGRKLTMEKCVKPFKEWMQNRGQSTRTIDNYLLNIERWLWDVKIANLPPSAITEQHIARWVNRKDDNAGVPARLLGLTSIRTFFDFLCAKGWVSGNPSQCVGVDMEKLSHEQKERKPVQPFTEAEVKSLVTHLKKEDNIFWLFAVMLSHSTGLRLSDIAQLEWKSFDEPNKIVVHTGKTNQRVELPLSDELVELTTQIPVHSSVYLFPEQRDISLDTKRRSYLSVQFSRICAKVGIKDKSFHGLRHTAATAAAKGNDKEALIRRLVDNLSLKEAKALLGHASSETTKRYVH